jgi:hypothetical protein
MGEHLVFAVSDSRDHSLILHRPIFREKYQINFETSLQFNYRTNFAFHLLKLIYINANHYDADHSK